MSELHRLVDSVLVPGFEGTSMPDWLARRLEGGLAGVCWFGHNVVDADRVRPLADDLHAAREGVLVLCDEEGGTVTRLEAAHGSSWPGHAALGHLDDVSVTRAVAAELGRASRAAGIDVVLAPVVDVNSDPANPVIGVRSFGADPRLVARHGSAFVRGLQESGVAACAKHYPGHGATRTDSHLDLPRVDADAGTLRRRDIAPFEAAVAAGVRCVMTAHVVFPALDDAPATMSPRLLGLLREEIGFDGVICSDALDMKAISAGVGRGAGAVRALASGVDLVCIGNPCFPETYDAEAVLDEVAGTIVSAVDDGVLGRERLEAAAARVADLASWVDRGDPSPGRAGPSPGRAGPSPGRGDPSPGSADHHLGLQVARCTLSTRGDVRLTGEPVLVQVTGPVDMAAGQNRSPLVAALLARQPATQVLDPDRGPDLEDLTGRWRSRPVVAVLGPRRDADADGTLSAVLAARPDAVVVYTGLPTSDDRGARTVHCFGGGRAAAEAVCDLLLGRRER